MTCIKLESLKYIHIEKFTFQLISQPFGTRNASIGSYTAKDSSNEEKKKNFENSKGM